jgi:hypothetical protein
VTLRPRRRYPLPAALIAATLWVVGAGDAAAGPPFADDPEPVELHHWELYLATQTARDHEGWSGTAPHIEVNYGLVSNLQLHVIAPSAYDVPKGQRATAGFGDMELGIKFRFLQEHKWTPMIGMFPLVELPTASRPHLGNPSTQVFVPVWLQKSFGQWTTYGGWGTWLDTGDASRHWWFFGVQLQRKFGKHVALGAEIYHETPETRGARTDTPFNVGAIFNITDDHHLLVSAGRSIVGQTLFQAYFAYQLTVGPK